MRTFKQKIELPRTEKNPWSIIEDVNSYPGLVGFVKKAKLLGSFEKGSSWYDITSILWVPLKIVHRITALEKGKRVDYYISLPFGGWMLEKILLKGKTLEVEVSLSLSKPIDSILGPVLERRLRQMVKKTFENVDRRFR